MKRSLRVAVLSALVAALALCLGSACLAATQDDLGRTDKLRIVVDKVLMKANKWVMTEEHVADIARTGFNVVSPRLGNDKMAEVRKIARAAQANGIFHMPWMRGTLTSKADHRMVWSNGTVQDLYSPNSDELWDWMTGRIVDYAKISVEIPSLMGVFLDYENYAPQSQGNAYGLSYDAVILEKFAEAKGIKIPKLAEADRYPWLQEKGLHDEFSAFQIDHWRERCRALRKAVDAINPKFQFCVYPAPGTLFMEKAIWPEWGTQAAPLILTDACTYGRPTGMLPHKESLAANRKTLTSNMQTAKASGFPIIYSGGIDPVVRGADPEFCGKNAVMISEATDGYWIFYEGPNVGRDHEEYWDWFKWANQAIVERRFDKQYEERETADEWGSAELIKKTDKPQIALYGMKSRMHEQVEEAGTFEVHNLSSNLYDYLTQLDVIVMQNFNVELEWDSEWVRTLRKYVQDGGGLMLAHDTAWFMDSPFPEIALRDIPTQKTEAVI